MIKKPFREHHLLALLAEYDQQQLPLDFSISQYFRGHKSLGSQDRAFIAETVYSLVRWKGLFDHLGEGDHSWENRYQLFLRHSPLSYINDSTIPLHIRYSFPEILFNSLVKTLGEEKACELCFICNAPAPTAIRVNTLKTTREALFEKFEKEFDVRLCTESKNGIIFNKKINFFTLSEYKEGLFAVQDEGSQLIADLVQAKPGESVLDYCSGSGGKTLAFAPQMNNKGQIFLHDIRTRALMEARKRLKGAGIQNAQIIEADSIKLKKIKKKMDWVLVDAPCTGTGTLRRNPDMKWRFDEETIPKVTGLQRLIFEKALSYLAPGGKIVYATCSILAEENEDQVNHFIETYGLEIVGEPFRSIPTEGGMDGFYGVVLQKKV